MLETEWLCGVQERLKQLEDSNAALRTEVSAADKPSSNGGAREDNSAARERMAGQWLDDMKSASDSSKPKHRSRGKKKKR